ncbi:hypothetical protein [Flavobacterium sp.]|uniref:hypothetical protein n=1 Tax=Flavobacterium sp. TaxID=239 RepID=UPI00286A5906|nr:hypothetical protein [Flavobacterium sp.]
MKLIAKFTLFVFITFLTTPTIVTLIEKNSDISMFYSFAEEENHKEIKADLRLNFDYPFMEVVEHQNSKIIFENLTRHDNIAEEIFIPPPELV